VRVPESPERASGGLTHTRSYGGETKGLALVGHQHFSLSRLEQKNGRWHHFAAVGWQEAANRGLKPCFTGKPGSSIPGHGRFT
jgi:hypothetical protein